MNLLAPLARPLFAWNSKGVMLQAGAGLARFLGVPLVSAEFTAPRFAWLTRCPNPHWPQAITLPAR